MSRPDILRHAPDVPSNWRGEEIADDPAWIHSLSRAEVDDLERGLAAARATGKPLLEIRREDFPLGVLANAIAGGVSGLILVILATAIFKPPPAYPSIAVPLQADAQVRATPGPISDPVPAESGAPARGPRCVVRRRCYVGAWSGKTGVSALRYSSSRLTASRIAE